MSVLGMVIIGPYRWYPVFPRFYCIMYRKHGSPSHENNDLHVNIFPQIMRDEFEEEAARKGKERLLLTVAVAVGEDFINGSYEIPQISRLVTYTYTFVGPKSAFKDANSCYDHLRKPHFTYGIIMVYLTQIHET